jgi:uncharacterized protein (DUF4415 family)
MMENDVNFNKATRRLLFRDAPAEENPAELIPGAGKSAAETPERHIRIKVTMNLDGDVVAFFKARAKNEGQPYQSLINQILRDYVSGSRPERMAKDVAEVLLQDSAFLDNLAQKIAGHEKD